jgi:hypothetical protein
MKVIVAKPCEQFPTKGECFLISASSSTKFILWYHATSLTTNITCIFEKEILLKLIKNKELVVYDKSDDYYESDLANIISDTTNTSYTTTIFAMPQCGSIPIKIVVTSMEEKEDKKSAKDLVKKTTTLLRQLIKWKKTQQS